MWSIPAAVLTEGSDEEIILYCAKQVENAEEYLRRVGELLEPQMNDPAGFLARKGDRLFNLTSNSQGIQVAPAE